jgi:hypothetical protein
MRVQRSVRQLMRYLPAVLVFVTCKALAADLPEAPQGRDGAWLQNGIRQYQRFNAHENLSDKEAKDALVVTSYVCAVVDLEKYLVQRADLLAGALQAGRKKKQYINPEELKGMSAALPMLVPLMETKFFTDSPTCDSVFVIVRDYLDKYPEVLPKAADAVVEKALLDAYANSDP